MRDLAVSVMFVTTAVLNLLARQHPSTFRDVHTLVFGGERPADPLALREILLHGPPRRLLNGYGPTECTVFSSFHHVSSSPSRCPRPHRPPSLQRPPLHPRQAPAPRPHRRPR